MAFASDNRSSECGGVLIGEVFQDDLGMYITIDAMIEAKNAASSHTSLTFTHETWDYIYRIKDENYPTQRIIGWFHTHPGFGVFLSKHDLFIHESFFNQEWQVALVVDPVRYQAGFFAWYDNEVGRVPGFFVLCRRNLTRRHMLSYATTRDVSCRCNIHPKSLAPPGGR